MLFVYLSTSKKKLTGGGILKVKNNKHEIFGCILITYRSTLINIEGETTFFFYNIPNGQQYIVIDMSAYKSTLFNIELLYIFADLDIKYSA